MFKKLISILLTLSIIASGNIVSDVKAEGLHTYFIVTAYYSPLPNQSHYIMGTYEKEIRMNGRGIRGASGKKVFSGMLAAPSKYSFGTKIQLEGLGVGEVSDRGGAIVQAGERNFKHDRIDIWLGHGEEGLQRAMYWGNRTIKGTIVNTNNKATLKNTSIPAPRWTIYHAQKNKNYNSIKSSLRNKTILVKNNKQSTKNNIKNIFNKPLQNTTDIKKLQEKLIQVGLYDGELTGNYESIRNIITTFQLNHQVIKNTDAIGTGYFGPQTRKTFKKYYKDSIEKQKILEKKEMLKIKIKEKNIKIVTQKINGLGAINKGDVSHEVRELQKILIQLGFLNHKDTAIFGPKTSQALISYQLDRKIISDSKGYGTGLFGPNTRKQLIKDLSEL